MATASVTIELIHHLAVTPGGSYKKKDGGGLNVHQKIKSVLHNYKVFTVNKVH